MTISNFFIPSIRLIKLELPTPNKLLTILKESKIGADKVTAAVCNESFNVATKNVSERLYNIVTSELKTIGKDIIIIAFIIGIVSNKSCLLLISTFMINPHLLVDNDSLLL